MCSGQSQKERFFYYSIAFTPLRIYKKEHKYIPCLSLPTIFLFRLIAQRYISRGAIILALWIQHLTDGNVMSLQTNVKHELGIGIVSFSILSQCPYICPYLEGSLFLHYEKVDKEQLNRKRFEIYHTFPYFGVFFQTVSLNNMSKLVTSSVKLTISIEIIIKSTFSGFCHSGKSCTQK